MEMRKINSGKLRASGYDAKARILHLQYFHGYGESLIDYNQKHTMPFENSC